MRPSRSPSRVPRTMASRPSALQLVLVEAAALDDRRQMRTLVLEEAQILGGIAVDDEQICVGARHDLAELSRTLNDLGVDDSRGVDDFVRLHHLRPDQELAALVILHLAEQIAAEADLHAGRTAKLERAQARGKNDLVLLQAVGGQSVAGTTPLQAIVGNQRRHDVSTALG